MKYDYIVQDNKTHITEGNFFFKHGLGFVYIF